jgi:hypothetical protein
MHATYGPLGTRVPDTSVQFHFPVTAPSLVRVAAVIASTEFPPVAELNWIALTMKIWPHLFRVLTNAPVPSSIQIAATFCGENLPLYETVVTMNVNEHGVETGAESTPASKGAPASRIPPAPGNPPEELDSPPDAGRYPPEAVAKPPIGTPAVLLTPAVAVPP